MTDSAAGVSHNLSFVGEGDLPPELDRVNWGAWAFAPIWALLYGPGKWRPIILTAFLATIVIDNAALLYDSRDLFPAVQAVTTVVFALYWPPLCAVYAYGVDRWVWERERTRIAQLGEAPPNAIAFQRYMKSRRFWGRLFIGIFVLIVIANVILLSTGLAGIGAFSPSLALVVLATLFVLDRLRARGPRS